MHHSIFTPELAAVLGDAFGDDFAPTTISACSGGSIHHTWQLSDGKRQVFVKRNAPQALPQFEAEAAGLNAIARAQAFRTPQVYGAGQDSAGAFLAMEFLALTPIGKGHDAALFAEALARMHRMQGSRFGWEDDNFIGNTPQSNKPHESWPLFFANERLQPQIDLARQHGASSNLVRTCQSLAEQAPCFFVDYTPQPSLIHGDLWSGNAAMVEENGERLPVIFDPAIYYGDREADLAMTELFGGFPLDFYAQYRAIYPLDSGYEQRKTLYNLYHMLNHLNLFGLGYLSQCERMASQLLSWTRNQ